MVSMITHVRENVRRILSKRHIQAGILVFLMVLLGFGVGYLVGRDASPAPIIIENNAPRGG